MQFNSTIFVFLFLPVVVAVNWLLRRVRVRNLWLLAASMLFYGWCNAKGLAFILVYGFLNYCFAWMISAHPRKKAWMVLAVGADVGALFVFKYFNFAASTMNMFLGSSIPALELFMPMGISFVTFTAIAYLIDVYKGTTKPISSLPDYYLYLLFFVKAAQGPITRYAQLEQDMHSCGRSFEKLSGGMKRFIIGFAKKCLIADVLGKTVDMIFGNLPLGVSCGTAWLGVLFYTFQIYYDFTGYTDMAIGIGGMLGFSLPENFDKPYLSTSVSEFWRRWHITLGRWFRDYIYIPLGGNRRGTARTVFNLAVVWLVTGIWHGAAFNYILWGVYYGLLVIGEKFITKTGWYQKIPKAVKWALTFFAVNMGWVMFRSGSMQDMAACFKALFGLAAAEPVYAFDFYFDIPGMLALGMAVIAALPLPKRFQQMAERSDAGYLLKNIGLILLFALSVVYMVNSTYNSFIYFQF